MKPEKKRKLTQAGGTETTIPEFLELAPADVPYIEAKVALAAVCVNCGGSETSLKLKLPLFSKPAKADLPEWKQATRVYPWIALFAASSRWAQPGRMSQNRPDPIRFQAACPMQDSMTKP